MQVGRKELEDVCGNRHGNLFSEMDRDGDGEADVEEFVEFMQVCHTFLYSSKVSKQDT